MMLLPLHKGRCYLRYSDCWRLKKIRDFTEYFFPHEVNVLKKHISQREKSPLIRNSFGLHIQPTISVVSWGVSGHLIYLSKCSEMMKLVTPLSLLFPVSYGTESPCHFAESGDREKGSIVKPS